MPDVVTRFAPSPTGFLHIGGARTALFNWLYARRHGGKFLLRIEDTDRKRLIQEAVDAIIKGLKWLGVSYDGEVVYQSKRIERHKEIANLLVEKGIAYHCYCPEHEVTEKKRKAREGYKIYKHKCTTKPSSFYLSPRDLDPKKNMWISDSCSKIASDIRSVIRFKMPLSQEIVINDKIYGQIKVSSEQLDDIVILRSDNTPTYIFAVLVDDHDYGITDIIRGSDHLANTFKQLLIYEALDFNIPRFAHVPLIHGEDGNKISKRHGAISVCDYEKMGILAKAMRNYLLRLGWSHGNDEIISDKQAIEWFNLESIGRSPARLNLKKLEHLNNYYISNMSNEDILTLVLRENTLTDKKKSYLLRGMTELKKRANYLTELLDLAKFYIQDPPFDLSKEAYQIVKSNLNIIKLLVLFLSKIADENWNKRFLSFQIKEYAKSHDIKINVVYHSLRATITGVMDSPGIIDIIVILGKDECIRRLQQFN